MGFGASWAFMPEVSGATGSSRATRWVASTRSADGCAIRASRILDRLDSPAHTTFDKAAFFGVTSVSP